MTWRTPGSAPLSPDELTMVYHVQATVGAVKECERCRKQLPVSEFAAYGRRFCWDCGTREPGR